MTQLTRTDVGEIVTVELPFSEVCMHLRVAGKVHRVHILEHGAQILDADGLPLSFAVLHGEAGIYSDAHGFYYYPGCIGAPPTFKYAPCAPEIDHQGT